MPLQRLDLKCFGMKFMMLYLMPLMLLFWFNNYSSGLSYYYLVSNIITIGQTYGFRFIVNEEKLHQRMKENAKKPRKMSKIPTTLRGDDEATRTDDAQKISVSDVIFYAKSGCFQSGRSFFCLYGLLSTPIDRT